MRVTPMLWEGELLSGRQATFSALRAQVDAVLADATPETHQTLYAALGIAVADRLRFINFSLDAVERALAARAPAAPIPDLIHRLWLTDPAEPRFPSERFLTRVARRIERTPGYRTIFWHNSDKVVDNVRQICTAPGLEFRRIDSISGNDALLERIERAIAARKHVLAGDIAKYLILLTHGGVYGDIGIDFQEELLELVKSADVSLFLDQNLFFQPAFMAAAPNSAPFRLWCRLSAQPEVLSALTFPDATALRPGQEIWLHGGVGSTAALMLDYDSSYSVLPVAPNRGLLPCESEGSWYREGNKFGNVSLSEASVTHLDFATHRGLVDAAQEIARAHPEWTGAKLSRLQLEHLQSRLYWLR